MADLFSGLIKGLSGIIPQDTPDMKIFNIQNSIKELDEKEEKLYANIGRKLYNPQEHTEYTPELELIAKNRENFQLQLSEAQKEKHEIERAKQEAIALQEAKDAERSCSQCGTYNDEGVRFCQECGNKLEAAKPSFCGNCGTEVPADKNFCGKCGQKIN